MIVEIIEAMRGPEYFSSVIAVNYVFSSDIQVRVNTVDDTADKTKISQVQVCVIHGIQPHFLFLKSDKHKIMLRNGMYIINWIE